MQHTLLRRAKSIAGAALIGLGVFVLHGNLGQASGQLSHFFGTSHKALGALPALFLAAFQVLQADAFSHHRLLQNLFQHVLVTFWPLLLVIAGTALSREDLPSDAATIAKKDCEVVDPATRRSTLD
ncbi:MAG: hypothetical protein ACRD3L_00530 [Terriglobales bacterium]